MSEDNKPMTGAYIHQQRAQKRFQTVEGFADMKLRQWCCELSLKAPDLTGEGYVWLANAFFNFITNKETDNDKESPTV